MLIFTFIFNYLLPFFAILSILIGLHEGGHYLAARIFGVAIKRFSLGMGPVLLRRTDRKGTEWALSLLPLGGYVGMVESLSGEPGVIGRPYSLATRIQRAIILAAGPFVNLVAGFLFMVAASVSLPVDITPPVIQKIIPASVAEHAGLMAGDRIIALNHTQINTFNDIARFMMVNMGAAVDVLYNRNGINAHVLIIPELKIELNEGGRRVERGLLGIESGMAILKTATPGEWIPLAWNRSVNALKTTAQILSQMIRGQRSLDGLQGIVGMTQTTGKTFAQHNAQGQTVYNWTGLVVLAALLSLNLALLNLIPIPILDGGQLVVLLIESIMRRDLPVRVKGLLVITGTAAVAGLFVFTLLQDIRFS